MKMVLLVADGMGDWPVEELGAQTTVAYAKTPHMDHMARTGVVGTARTVPSGMEPGSDVANMSLLGYDPATYHTGRGPIEAAAQGLDLAPDDLVWRMNVVTVSELSANGFMRDYSSGHIPSEVSIPLVEELQSALGNDTFSFYPGVQYRHLLVQRGGAKGPDVNLRIAPPHDLTDKSIAGAIAAYEQSPDIWELVQAASAKLAAAGTSKANAIWPWGQGTPLSLPAFADTLGLSGAVISAVDLVKGLGRAAGMEVIDVPGATGLVDTNYKGKLDAALNYLNSGGEFVCVHIEGPDECGHGGDVQCKVTALERIDELVLGPLREGLTGQEVAFVVTCDHYTPLAIKTHNDEPVPFAVWTEAMENTRSGCGRAKAFTEAEAAHGERIAKGHELLAWALDRAKQL